MKKNFWKFMTMLIVGSLLSMSVNAKSVLEIGNRIDAKGDYDSSSFILGQEIKSDTQVDGISFVAGNDIESKGDATYGIYAGNIIRIETKISKDLFIAGNTINIASDAKIGRDVYIAGSDIKINADIERNARIAGDIVDLSGIEIGGNAYIEASRVILDKSTKIHGKLSVNDDAIIEGKDEADISETALREVVSSKTLPERLLSHVINSISSFIVMAVLFLVAPKIREQLDDYPLDNQILKSCGKGLVILIIVPLLGLFAITMSIFIPLAIISFMIYGTLVYLSSLVSAYVLGKSLNEKFIKKENVYLSLALGLVIFKIVYFVPVLGPLTNVLSIFYGLGLFYDMIVAYRQKFKNNKQER